MAIEKLVECSKIRISSDSDADVHRLVIGGKYLIVLERGVLEELSRTSAEELKGKLDAVNPDSAYFLEKANLTYEAVGFAIAQARLIELEREFEAYRSR
ncbi:MAG: hypothetical protein U1B79_01400 [Candidatus Pacearchaeota archaeon]|nr:hypothetical protein [Nanoarchaeota archaeon]MDZ4226747.1 hypothetical protein [Candidatus Pacearchaeota archaeon]